MKLNAGALCACGLGAALGALSCHPDGARAATAYSAVITELYNAGVTGTASLTLDSDDLTIAIVAIGLEPDMPHAVHIHGAFDDSDNPIDSVTPTRTQDGDGFIELAEGAPSYGPVIVPLTSPPYGDTDDFPTAPGGTVVFNETYDLINVSTFADSYDGDDLMPFFFHEIVIHGMTTKPNDGVGTGGEVDGTGGYQDVLPVAAGPIELAVVAESASAALSLLSTVCGFWRKRRT